MTLKKKVPEVPLHPYLRLPSHPDSHTPVDLKRRWTLKMSLRLFFLPFLHRRTSSDTWLLRSRVSDRNSESYGNNIIDEIKKSTIRVKVCSTQVDTKSPNSFSDYRWGTWAPLVVSSSSCVFVTLLRCPLDTPVVSTHLPSVRFSFWSPTLHRQLGPDSSFVTQVIRRLSFRGSF